MKKKIVRMKEWAGWCVVCRNSGDAWYAVVESSLKAARQSWGYADDGSKKTTRLARVRVTEVMPAKKKARRK